MLRRSSLILLIGTASFLLGSTHAASAAPVAPPDTTDALIALESEVVALVDLDAFGGPIPTKLTDVAADWNDDIAGLDRTDLLGWLHDSEVEGAELLAGLDGVTPLSPAVRTTLGPLPEGAIRAVEGGGKLMVDPAIYEHALNDLEFRNGSEPAHPAGESTQPPASAPADGGASNTSAVTPASSGDGAAPDTAGASRTNSRTTDPGGEDSGSKSGSGSPLPLLIGGGAVVVIAAIGIGLLLARRGRRVGAAPALGGHLDGSVAQLLDASRRFGSTIDVAEIHRILVTETLLLTGASEAAVVTVDDASRATVVDASSDGAVVAAQLDRGAVRRVLETGAAIRTVADDPAFGDGQRSVLVAPLVRNGVIAGAVVALREPSSPFTALDLDVLGQLVPMGAAALVSAGRHDDVAELSLTDGLTELGNRRRLDRDLVAALAVGAGTVGFVMVDIDHFKHYNDTHGHVAGDFALQRVAHILRDNVRDIDVVYRYGGEEFCVLLPEATATDAADVSERLRGAIEAHDFTGAETQPGGRLTISVGTTVANRTDPTEVKERADHALYEAKHRGRNQVVVEGPDALH